MLQDFRFGLKLLWKEKAFTVTALLTLALCIGANTAIFTVLRAVVLEPLAFAQPDRLVSVFNIYPGIMVTDNGSNAVPDYFDRRQLTEIFDSVALSQGNGFDLGAEGSPVHLEAQSVTPSFFHVLRVSPAMGRAFTEDDAVYKKDQFVILSYGLWMDKLAGDPHIVGREIRLDGLPYRVVGVMPQSFESPGSDAKLWVPLSFKPEQTLDSARHSNSWDMIARLQPGVTIAAAQHRIDVLNKFQVERAGSLRTLLENARFGSVVRGLKDEMVRNIKPTLYLLQAAVLFVLLIGCVNVANLMLVRSNIRMKELAIRHSLGAARGRLARQLLTESVTLAALGGLLGIALAYAGVRVLAVLGAQELPRGAAIHLDAGALVFSAAVAGLTGLIFGSVPVYHLMRRDLNVIFRQTGRTGTSERGAVWTRSALVVCQVSLAFVLLIGAGLLTLSFARLLNVSPGFQTESVETAAFALPHSRYPDDAHIRGFFSTVMDGVGAIPGLSHAGLTTILPFGGNNNNSVLTFEGRTLGPGENPPVPEWNVVDPGYLATMGIPLLQGRGFTASDTADSQDVAIIDQYLAHKYFPKGDAIGARIIRGLPNLHPDKNYLCTIVGVVGSVKISDLAERNPIGQVYFAAQQYPQRYTFLVVKSQGNGAGIAAAVRREFAKADPELPLFDVKTMSQRLATSVRQRRAAMAICGSFAGLALVLSALGIYGVLAYTVSQRTREFGIRIALGARAGTVVGMVMAQGLRLAAIGLALGVAGAVLLTRLMEKMLYDVKPTDPAVFAIVAGVLMAVAMAAALVPSLRVARIKPASALRVE
jgi:predicted permease